MFTAIRRMEALRNEYAVFDSEGDVWLPDTANNHVIAIGRYYRGEQLLALFNFSDEPQVAWTRDEKIYTDLISGKETDAGAIRLEGGEFLWLLHDFGTGGTIA